MPRRNVKVRTTATTREYDRNRKRARLAARRIHPAVRGELPALKRVGVSND